MDGEEFDSSMGSLPFFTADALEAEAQLWPLHRSRCPAVG
jgi:hypothetical protein